MLSRRLAILGRVVCGPQEGHGRSDCRFGYHGSAPNSEPPSAGSAEPLRGIEPSEVSSPTDSPCQFAVDKWSLGSRLGSGSPFSFVFRKNFPRRQPAPDYRPRLNSFCPDQHQALASSGSEQSIFVRRSLPTPNDPPHSRPFAAANGRRAPWVSRAH
jgi:hypothetical protein